MKKDITDMRRTIEFLKQAGELLVAKEPVDSVLEISGIQVALEEGPCYSF